MRQRRNKTSTARTLSSTPPKDIAVPELPPGRDWLDATRTWWADVWSSPMAAEFVDGKADIHGLYILAVLVDQFWTSPSEKLAGEIRLQRSCFGLTPMDRRRLQWEIERAEDAKDRGTKRRAAKPASRPASDPRSALRAV